MRILVLANFDVGLYNFRKELLQRLLDEGNEVYISLPYGEKVDLLKEIGCKFIDTQLDRHGTNPFAELKLIRYYKNLMRRIKPDVVFSYTIKPNLYGGMAAASLDIPYIANITGLGTAVENGGLMLKITLMLYRYAFRKVNRVFVQNKENRQFFIEHNIATDKLTLLPGSGVNLEQYRVLPYPNDDTIEFVFISRIMKEKGIEQYLSAAEYIRDKYPNTRFHICGFCEEDYTERLSQMQEKGIIIYHGMVRDIAEVLKRCHCTVHPTYYPEGMSNVLLESCASGRPIITTDRSGCREVVEDDMNGYVVKQQDSDSLIYAILKFIALPNEQKKKMGLNGRAKVEKEFDRQIIVDAYVEEIGRIINNEL